MNTNQSVFCCYVANETLLHSYLLIVTLLGHFINILGNIKSDYNHASTHSLSATVLCALITFPNMKSWTINHTHAKLKRRRLKKNKICCSMPAAEFTVFFSAHHTQLSRNHLSFFLVTQTWASFFNFTIECETLWNTWSLTKIKKITNEGITKNKTLTGKIIVSDRLFQRRNKP